MKQCMDSDNLHHRLKKILPPITPYEHHKFSDI